MVFGLGQSLTVWLPAQVCLSLNFPLLGSARNALWLDKIPPLIQERIFAANSLAIQAASALAILLAGPLADQLLEPAMMPGKPVSKSTQHSFWQRSWCRYRCSLHPMCSVDVVGWHHRICNPQPEGN